MKYGCRVCRKEVQIRDGQLSCCGITESLSHVKAANRIQSENIAKALSPLFSPVAKHWRSDADENDYGDPYDYEGIPNT